MGLNRGEKSGSSRLVLNDLKTTRVEFYRVSVALIVASSGEFNSQNNTLNKKRDCAKTLILFNTLGAISLLAVSAMSR